MTKKKEATGKIKDRIILGRIFSLTKPYLTILIFAAILSVTLAPLSVLRPYLVQITVDNNILRPDMKGLEYMLIVLISILLIEGILSYLFTYSTGFLGQSIIKDLRIRVFNHINSLRLSYFDKTPIGTSTTRTINDIETINTVFSEGVITIIADLLTLVVVLGMMFYTSWQLTLVCLITLPFLIWSSYWFKEAVKKSYEIIRSQVSYMNAFLQERISGMRIVQIFNAEEQEWKKFEAINQKYTKANIKSIFYYAIFFPIVEILSAASLGLMVWYGAGAVIDNQLTLGVLIAFPLYLGMLFRPVRMLADKFNSLQMGMVAARRVFEILDNRNNNSNNGSIEAKNIKGDLKFEHVFFSYDQDKDKDAIEQWILSDISFELEAGKTMAVVGSTGAGKSTIINILNRFYEIQDGKIFIDGIELRDYEIFSLRKHIGIVLQDVFLFSGTIYENISLKDESISKERVIEAAKMIGADEFIRRLPGNYDYQVMERGATLSMGQRQLISFVRALVFNPSILILDEATSAIDPETESVIQHAIEKLIEKRTSIIIAHRLTTIQHADNILVIERGKVLERGTHSELMQKEDGHYRNLVETAYSARVNE